MCVYPHFPPLFRLCEYVLMLSGWHESKWSQRDNKQCHEKVFTSLPLLDHYYRSSYGGMAMKFPVHAPEPFVQWHPLSAVSVFTSTSSAWIRRNLTFSEPRGTYPSAVAGEDSPCGQSVLEGVFKGSSPVLVDEVLAVWRRRTVCLLRPLHVWFLNQKGAEWVACPSLRCLQMDTGLT